MIDNQLEKISGRLKEIRIKLGLTQKQVAESIGYAQNTVSEKETYSDKLAKVGIALRYMDQFCDKLGVNKKYLYDGEGDMFLPKARVPKLEAKPLRLADPMGFEATNERFYTLPDDSLIMQVSVIPYKAWGSYLRGHADPEFYEDLETIPLPVDKKHFGSYLIFEMGGDSMINITNQEMARKSLWPGQKIVGRDLSKDKWKYKLHINTTEAWIIVHRIEGIVVKAIVDHDVEHGLITLHSWNPDKETYPDFTVSLDDVEQIFNVVDPFNKM